MRQNWKWNMVPLVCAAMLVACGRDGMEERRADAGVAPERVTLTGCVQTGPATDQYVLQNVRVEEEPLGSAPEPAVSDIVTEGAWVRLWKGGPVNLDQYVSQEVRVTGRLLDTGEPTGTAGAEGYETPSGDRSLQDRPDKPHWERKAAEAGPIGQESIATGREPTLQIETVNATGRPCSHQPQ